MLFHKTFSKDSILWLCYYPVSGQLETLVIKKTREGKFQIGSFDSTGSFNGFFKDILTFNEARKKAHEIIKGRTWVSSKETIKLLKQADLLSYLKHLHVTVRKHLNAIRDPNALEYLKKACQAVTKLLSDKDL